MERRHAARHHAYEQLLAGWFGCCWPRHPTSPNGYDGQHTTRPSLTSHCSWGGLRVERRCTQPPASNNAPPAPSLTSHCSWGGSRVERRCTQPTRHPLPASRATARGVEIGGHHCPLLQHPQPLPRAIARGGEGVLCERWCVAGGVSTGIQWNNWILGSPIRIGGGV